MGMQSTKGVELALLATSFVVLFELCCAPPVCSRDHYWFRITGTCEPCSRICDPPGRHENDCPRLCPEYHPATTTLPQVNPGAIANNTSTPAHATEGTGSEKYSMPWVHVVLIAILIATVLLGVNLAIGCLLYKKRMSLKKLPLVRWIFNKDVYPTTVKALYQPTDARQGGESEPEQREMLGNQHEKDDELVPGVDSIH